MCSHCCAPVDERVSSVCTACGHELIPVGAAAPVSASAEAPPVPEGPAPVPGAPWARVAPPDLADAPGASVAPPPAPTAPDATSQRFLPPGTPGAAAMSPGGMPRAAAGVAPRSAAPESAPAVSLPLGARRGAFGALLIAIGCALDWSGTTSALHVPAASLIDTHSHQASPTLAWFLFAIGAVGVFAAVSAGGRVVRIVAGSLGYGIALLYLVQAARSIEAAHLHFSKIVGAGPYVVAVGAVLLGLSAFVHDPQTRAGDTLDSQGVSYRKRSRALPIFVAIVVATAVATGAFVATRKGAISLPLGLAHGACAAVPEGGATLLFGVPARRMTKEGADDRACAWTANKDVDPGPAISSEVYLLTFSLSAPSPSDDAAAAYGSLHDAVDVKVSGAQKAQVGDSTPSSSELVFTKGEAIYMLMYSASGDNAPAHPNRSERHAGLVALASALAPKL